MSTNEFAENPFIAGMDEIRSSWGWLLVLGILLMLLGAICIVADVSATFATVLVFGWLLLISGVVALVQAFRTRNWSGFFLYLLSALLRGFTGYLLIRYPLAGAASLTLVLAAFFVVGGIFRSIGAGMIKFPRWGWSLFSGLVSVALGIMLLAQMPVSSIWFIGFAIGVDLIFEGASLIGFATAIHHILPRPKAYQAA
ncbi:MAG TPA: HdeD family acid-resistance protein [Candidatus Acidoferrales bacterium]|nr:HdeD family acid-resistance protein [Candidatus Acidoferrales bacterium]